MNGSGINGAAYTRGSDIDEDMNPDIVAGMSSTARPMVIAIIHLIAFILLWV